MFQDTAVSAVEGSIVPICVELNDTAERIVTFALLITSGSATGLRCLMLYSHNIMIL